MLDFGGGTFAPLTELPHVAGVATRSEPDVVRRIVAEVQGIVDRREAYFREQRHRLDRDLPRAARRRAGPTTATATCSWSSTAGARCARTSTTSRWSSSSSPTRGLTFGLHIVAGAARWADFRAAMRDLFGTRLELRLGDPMDSEIDRKVAALVPGRPAGPRAGAGQAALPRRAAAHRRRRPRRHASATASRTWSSGSPRPGPGRPGPKLRLLPERIELDEVREHAGRRQVRRATTAAPARHRREGPRARSALDVDAEPHLLIFGDGQSGKSAVLRTYAHEIMRTRTPKQAQIVRRRLPALAARRGARRVPAQLPHLRHPGARPRSPTSRRTSRAGSPVPT